MGDEEEALLFRYRYLLGSSQLDVESLTNAFNARLQEISLGSPVDHDKLKSDPIAQHRKNLQSINSGDSPDSYNGVWFSEDKKHALLLLHTSAPAFAIDRQEQAIQTIHDAFNTLNKPEITMLLSGPPLFGVESRERIRGDSQQLTLWGSIGVALLIFIAYRSFAATLLIALPLFSGIIAGAASVTLYFGELHAIALAFGITLIGLAVDYPIHLFSHGGTGKAATRIWPTLRLGMLSSAIGFSALLFSDFEGLSQMGLFAISGIIAAGVVTRWVLPAFNPTDKHLQPTVFSLEKWQPPVNHQGATAITLVALFVTASVYLFSQQDSLWERQLKNLSPIPAEQLEQDRRLRQHLGAADPGKVLLIQNRDQEVLLQQSEQLVSRLRQAQEQGKLGSFDAPSLYLPSAKTQHQNQHSLPTTSDLDSRLQNALQSLPFRADLFKPFIDSVTASKQLEPLTPAMLENTLLGLRMAPLLRKHESGWYALLPLGDVRDPSAIRKLAESSGARYLNIQQQASELVKQYRDEALALSLIGLLLILAMLAISLRSWSRVFRVIAPVLTAIVLTSALLHLLGEKLSLFHLASLLLVLGIGLDYGLFADRCRRHTEECHNTYGALLLCSATTLLVFSLLAGSSIPVLHAVGLTVALGVLMTLIFTLLGRHNTAT